MTTPPKIKRYGWVPDLPDHRDHLYAAAPRFLVGLPASVDLRPQCPPVYDQGDLQSCTANAIAAAFQFDLMKQKIADFVPSRLFIYYNERVMESSVGADNGAQIRDGVKSVASIGVCPEDPDWPYDVARFAAKPPDPPCYADAAKNKIVSYQRLAQSLNQMKGCLASSYPFVFGYSVYESFETEEVAKTGHAPMPSPAEAAIGGHAVMAVGYDDAKQWFIIRNSWGTAWGMAGYFTLPYAYLIDGSLSDDFWTIRLVA